MISHLVFKDADRMFPPDSISILSHSSSYVRFVDGIFIRSTTDPTVCVSAARALNCRNIEIKTGLSNGESRKLGITIRTYRSH